ncbi:hypothetical protein [Rufibacter immobilis]|uniref:hypothetical protein n=1 Tax=Rufibacter immobilis TaxID=1348778 RepID=UPI0035ECD8EA
MKACNSLRFLRSRGRLPGGTELKLRLFERQRVRSFLILLVTFLIKEKSDRRGQKERQQEVREERQWKAKTDS